MQASGTTDALRSNGNTQTNQPPQLAAWHSGVWVESGSYSRLESNIHSSAAKSAIVAEAVLRMAVINRYNSRSVHTRL